MEFSEKHINALLKSRKLDLQIIEIKFQDWFEYDEQSGDWVLNPIYILKTNRTLNLNEQMVVTCLVEEFFHFKIMFANYSAVSVY
jgi:hypothetical protein